MRNVVVVLDLAIVVRNDASINIPSELDRVSAALTERGDRTLFIEIAGEDGYLVLESLSGITLSYHPLQSMSPYVLEGWRVLIGSLDGATIRSAAGANSRQEPALSQQVPRALWLALGVDIILQRRQFWRALPGLQRMRSALVEIFAASAMASEHIRSLKNRLARSCSQSLGIPFHSTSLIRRLKAYAR